MAGELSATTARYGKKAIVHIKVDTGMGRLGFPCNRDAVREIAAVAALPHLEVEGIFTHFAAADCRDKRYTKEQLVKFTGLLEALDREGLEFNWKHAANSAALIDLPETHLNMVRAGIAMYGIYPSNEVNTYRVSLLPAMTLKARVSADEIAGKIGTIAYEVLCMVSSRVPRIYYQGGRQHV